MHKVVLYGISDNMSAIFQNIKYGEINTADLITMGYYVVKFSSAPYALQYDKKVDKKAIESGEIIVKTEYLSIMKYNNNWYWQKLGTK